jgi:hypothetical protein
MGKLKQTLEDGSTLEWDYIYEPMPEDLKWAIGVAASYSNSAEETKQNALMVLNVLDELRNDFRHIH